MDKTTSAQRKVTGDDLAVALANQELDQRALTARRADPNDNQGRNRDRGEPFGWVPFAVGIALAVAGIVMLISAPPPLTDSTVTAFAGSAK